MDSQLNSSINPGSDRAIKLPSYKTLLLNVFRKLIKFKIRLACNVLVAGLYNKIRHQFRGVFESDFYCPSCNQKVAFFYAHANNRHVIFNSICPHCNSRSRHRGLVFVYSDFLEASNSLVRILHFAPEPIFYSLFKGKSALEYQTADLFLKDVDRKEDIQNLTIPDGTYDIVLSNHVIEHVPDDDKALSEMCRILRSGGKAIITIPGDFQRDKTIYFNHLRYNGHYRDYGLDVLTKLKKHYKSVEMIDMHKFNRAIDGQNHGIRKADMVFVCAK